MCNSFGLTESELCKIQQVFALFPEVERVVIYGSRVKGNYRPSSDIDMSIMNDIDWETFSRIETELDELLLPYQIDLSIFPQIDNLNLIDHIQRLGKNLYTAT